MEKETTIRRRKLSALYPAMLTGKERLAVWERAREALKGRAPAMLKELRKMRKEWDRKLPSLT